MSRSTLPAPEQVARRAQLILASIEADPEFPRLREGCAKYDKAWQTFTGYALVDGFNVEVDTAPLFTEALRAMALKMAVYEMTGSEDLAELPLPVPIDEMIHAQAAQFTVLSRMQERTGLRFVHATDREDIGSYTPGDVTDRAYRIAWGIPNPRYWLSKEETDRRRAVVVSKYRPLGIHDGGRRFDAGFPLAGA